MFFSLSFGRFYGIDSLIELLIVIVSFVISYYSYHVYKLIKEKNYKFFSFAFFAIGFSFIFKIASNFTIMNRVIVERANFIFVIWSQLQYMQMINFLSFTFYKIFHVMGFLILFLIVTRTKKKGEIILFLYLSILAVLLSIYFNFIFHITLMFLLIFLTYHFYENYTRHKNQNTELVFIAFLIILVSHSFFVFSDMNSLFYLIGEGLLLIGFLSLLTNQIIIKRKNKNFKNKENEKNKTRNSERHIRYIAKK